MKTKPLLAIFRNRRLGVFLATCLALVGCGKEDEPKVPTENSSSVEEAIPDSQFPEDIQRIAKRLSWSAAAVAKVRNHPKEELQRMAEEYLNQNHGNGGFHELHAAEDLVADVFIDSLRKPDAFIKRGGSLGDYDCRAHQALSFLKSGAHPTLIPVLKEIMRRGEAREIRIIAFALSSFATMEVLEETSALLRNPDQNVARSARQAVLQALQQREIASEFRAAIWPACEASFLACNADISMSRNAASLLVAVDTERAGRTFQSSGVLDVNHPLLDSVLEILIHTETPPEESLLLAVLDKNNYANAYAQSRLHALALKGLALRKSSQAEARIMGVLDGEQRWDKTLGPAAWEARFKLAGRTPLAKSAFDSYFAKDHKIENLAPEERRICLIGFADSEFRNGGATQWFENHHGGYAAETLEALQHIGATKHAEIIEGINRILSPKGPVKQQEGRQRILEKLTEEDGMKLDRLTDQWYKLSRWEVFAYEWDWKRTPGEAVYPSSPTSNSTR